MVLSNGVKCTILYTHHIGLNVQICTLVKSPPAYLEKGGQPGLTLERTGGVKIIKDLASQRIF